jgi:hypothetical protein
MVARALERVIDLPVDIPGFGYPDPDDQFAESIAVAPSVDPKKGTLGPTCHGAPLSCGAWRITAIPTTPRLGSWPRPRVREPGEILWTLPKDHVGLFGF